MKRGACLPTQMDTQAQDQTTASQVTLPVTPSRLTSMSQAGTTNESDAQVNGIYTFMLASPVPEPSSMGAPWGGFGRLNSMPKTQITTNNLQSLDASSESAGFRWGCLCVHVIEAAQAAKVIEWLCRR